jgi:cutinase
VVAESVRVSQIAYLIGVSALTSSMMLAGTPSAHADPVTSAPTGGCPDAEVVFARGTTEAPGVGGIGQAFIDSLQTRMGGKSLWTYAVDYPASTDWPTAAQGVIDAADRIREMAAKCPTTKMVLGGYSQGAAVIGYVTAAAIPAGYTVPPGITGPMPPEVANHVAAVALFGEPSPRFLNRIDAPPIAIGPLYAAKTIQQCISDDPVCSMDGSNLAAHGEYVANGMVDQAADFVVQRLLAPPPGPLPSGPAPGPAPPAIPLGG